MPMMKFVVTQVIDGGGRLGRLSLVGRHGNDVTMETPACLLYTKGGSVPNLATDVASKLERLPSVMQVATPSVIASQDVLSEYSKGLASFTGQPEIPVYLSVQDPLAPSRTGYNEKNVVSVWSTGGRVKLSPENYMSFVESCQPAMFEALSDGDTPQGTSTKRTNKAVDRTVEYLDVCIERWQATEKLQGAAMLGVLQGGDMTSQRKRCASEVSKRPVSGFVLDGFHPGAMEDSARWSLLKEVLTQVAEDKPRVIPRASRPDDVLKAVQCGVDVFDSSFPLEVTNRDCALVFKFRKSNIMPEEVQEESNNAPDSAAGSEVKGQPLSQSEEEKCSKEKTDYEMDLTDSRYFDDFEPVLVGCKCYCCQNHTRAYINHLLKTKELLAKVLLTVHNLHHYFRFFESIRESLAKGTLQQLAEMIDEKR